MAASKGSRKRFISNKGIKILIGFFAVETRERGHRETFRRLGIFFTEEQLVQLDQLLVRGEELDRTPLAWLGERAAANSSKAILAELKKLDFLRELGVAEWDLSTINPNRLKFSVWEK
jgi:hypothetical protein